jgi:hypothetical protein
MPYLLPCPQCRTNLTVTTGEAGGQVRCNCGATVDVPTVRGLRELAVVTESAEPQSRWTTRHSVTFMGGVLLVAGIAAGLALHLYAESIRPVQTFADKVQEMSAAETWELWTHYFQLGIGTWQVDEGPTQKINRRRYHSFKNFQWISFGIAGVGAVIALVGWFALTPRQRQRPKRPSKPIAPQRR